MQIIDMEMKVNIYLRIIKGPMPIKFEHLEALTDQQAPLYGFVYQDMLRKMHKAINNSGHTFPIQTYNFLWAVTFLNTWLAQLKTSIKESKKIAIRLITPLRYYF
jgi:hypothetical protein